MADFDPIQLGRLIQSVETLNNTMTELRTAVTADIKELRADVTDLKDTRSKGWGILTGVTLVAGGVGSLGHMLAEKMFK